jgi:hypothetical protein
MKTNYKKCRSFDALGMENTGRLAAVLALGHDGGVKAIPHSIWELVDLMGAIDFDSLARGAESNFTVFAAAKMLVEKGTCLAGDLVINQFVQHRQKL